MYFENCYSNEVVVTPSAVLYTPLCYANPTLSHRTRINGETLCFINCMSECNLTWPHSQIFFFLMARELYWPQNFSLFTAQTLASAIPRFTEEFIEVL